jgi:hypothetical protein
MSKQLSAFALAFNPCNLCNLWADIFTGFPDNTKADNEKGFKP